MEISQELEDKYKPIYINYLQRVIEEEQIYSILSFEEYIQIDLDLKKQGIIFRY